MRRGKRVIVAAVGVAVASVVASCTGDDPGPVPTTSIAPAQTSTPDPAVSKPVSQLWRPTQDSAVAFVQYFIAAYNYAYATYDTSILEQISEPTCTFCKAIVDEVQDLQRDKVTSTDGQLSYVTAAFPDDVTSKGVFVLVVTDQRPGTTTTSDGATSHTDGYRKAQSGFGLKWGAGRWSVIGITVQKKGQPW